MIPNKTDKQLVWESIKRIEDWTSDVNHHQFVILPEDIWKDYPMEDRLRIRGLLLSNGFTHLVGNNQWAFQLTAAGMVLKEDDLKDNGLLKRKKSYKQFWLGVIATLIGTVASTGLSAVLEVWKAEHLQSNQSKTIVLPRIQVAHDTVYLKK